MLQNQFGQRVIQRQLLQYRLCGRWRPLRSFGAHGQTQLVKQDRLYLLGRRHVERLACHLMRLTFHLQHTRRQFTALLPEHRHIDFHAGTFHIGQHREQRALQVFKQRFEFFLFAQTRPEQLVQAQGHVGVFGCIRHCGFQRHLVEGQLFLALAGDVCKLDVGMGEIFLTQGIQIMTTGGTVQQVGLQHRIVGDALQVDAVVEQHITVIFQVMSELGALWIFKQGFELFQHPLPIQLVRCTRIIMRHGQIGCLARFKRK